ncbi:MAG: hypothetical protein JWO89_2309 [Verrucomicrobiaceae bacterium]|nr:hypothetical protein [Verrucomicrobiaceae bacterium]
MVWKFLSGISAACLGVALYFAYISKNDIHEERAAEQRAKANFATVQNYKKKADEALAQKGTQLKGLEADRDKLKTDVVTAEADSKKKEADLAQAKKSLTETVEQLTAVQKKIEEAGDVTKLVAQVQALQTEKKSAEAIVAAEAAKVTGIQEKLAGIQQQTERLRTVEANSRKGVIEPTFTARVAQAFTDWGFAVLNKGNNGGVIANAELEVKRGKNIVARLKVRNVEQAIAVADIVPGSLAQGYVVRSGDLVVAAPVKAEPPKTTPPAGEKTPAPPVTPGAPPVTTPPAMGAADPFAAAPAAPGAPAAPPAAPAMADPFAPAPGAAPAAPPATPPAEAPPAGAGTKTSPSTADPFAK